MKAKDIMTEEVATIRGSATVADAAKLMKLKALRALIVEPRYESDAYGIVTQKDLVYKVAAYGKDPANMRVFEIMTKPCIVVNPDLAVEYVARLFANTGIRMAPVISAGLVGIVSVSDILNKTDFIENPRVSVADRELAKAIEEAKSICLAKGIGSQECRDAWELAEDIETEAIYLSSAPPPEKTAFQLFCDEHPEVIDVKHRS